MHAARRLSSVLLIITAGACSSPTEQTTPGTFEKVVENGTLRLDLTDAPSPAGILFVRPTSEAGTGNVVVTSTRYGSLCLYDVSGDVTISGSSIVMRIRFAQRLAICTADIRKLTYRATLRSIPKGTYDLRVLHAENNASDETLSERVVIR